MRFYKIPLIILLVLILIFPLSVIAQVSPTTAIPQAVTLEEVRQFINEYTKQFTKMDLDSYMALFSKEAVENRMLPYADIREAYRRIIKASHSMQYDVEIHSIQTYTRSAFVSGRYKIIQTFKEGGKGRVFKGSIQWDLIRENGLLKIREINYGRDR